MTADKTSADKTSADTSSADADRRRPSFEILLDDIDGIFANARIAYGLTTVDRAVDHGEWSRAVDVLEDVADRLARLQVSRAGWQELLWAASWCGVHGDLVGPVAGLLTRYCEHGWPGDGPRAVARQAMPWQLGEVLGAADRRGRFEAGHTFGGALAHLYPGCPLGAYGAAHFGARMLHSGYPEHPRPAAIADQFERAGHAADELNMADLAERCTFRAGAVLLSSRTARQRGRQLLREVEPAHLSRQNSLWYAVAMSHSPHWLDRVRAADQVIELAEADQRPADRAAATEVRQVGADVRYAADYLLECAPVELQPLELDRLTALVAAVGDGLPDGAGRLELRGHLAGIGSAPAARSGEAADLLARDDRLQHRGGRTSPQKSTLDDSQPGQPKPEQAAIAFYRAVQGMLDADEATEPDRTDLARIRDNLPVAAAVVETLSAAHAANFGPLATALGDLEGQLRARPTSLGHTTVGPIALIWPVVLPLIIHLADDDADDIDATTLRRIEASGIAIMGHWLPAARPPSYGWWKLAANLQACQWPGLAAQVTRQALGDGESVADDLEQRVLAGVLDWAVQEADDDTLREWLEIVAARVDETD